MQFFIRCRESLDEWSILEIQGSLEVSDAENVDELEAGVLTLTGNSNATLMIGASMLEGKVTPLKKPLVVMKKKGVDQIEYMDEGDSEKDSSNSTEYEVVGIVKEKIIFKTRPKFIVTPKKSPNTKKEGGS
eukprot:TRINITY_DN5499_c0_g1_i1.p1 TRINITY_DN5499_c0_g1~~TRINITY_DN5499_c0_g1_i1.p1  ORF type:complete len:131 (-),score=38.08 TRINITY_DN5499_c0_g1_i1:77-469(-)